MKTEENALGRQIKHLLGKRSQTWLAKQADTTQPTISRLIRGENTPTIENINAIAQALDADPLHLMQLAGLAVPEEQQQEFDPVAAQIAQRLTELPPHIRTEAAKALGSMLDTITRVMEKQSTNAGA